MKKSILLGNMIMLLTLCSCGGVSQSEFDALESEKSAITIELESVKASLEGELEAALKENESLSAEIGKLESEFSSYKESMALYEAMEEAEANARIEKAKQEEESIAESKAAKKAEEEAKAKKESEEASKAAVEKEKKGYESGITYDQLARNPEKYEGEKVKFKGKVLQVLEGDEDGDENEIRLAVNGDYDDVILIGYDPSIVSSRILEDDTITIYGISVGTISYESTFGQKITIPGVYVDKIDQ